MKANVISFGSKKPADIELNDAVFGAPVRLDVLQRVVEWQRAKKQAGTHKTKERGEVNGTTAKPFKQKGTGRARQGSRYGPHQRGGSTCFGPTVRSHATALTKKFRKLGLKTALSSKAKDGKLLVLDEAKIGQAKTKELSAQLKKHNLTNVLFIDGDAIDGNFVKAAQNIAHVDVLPQGGANVYDILRHEQVVLTQEAVKQLEARLA